MATRTIVVPDGEPAFEWVNGRALQKVSPKRKHSLAQARFTIALERWAHTGGRGTVGPEWRFLIQPPGEERRPLVPDVAFLSYARVPFDVQQLTDEPEVAPEAVVEIVSPDDRAVDVEEKVRVYLAAGTDVVFLVDTQQHSVTIRDAHGSRTIERGVLEHPALPGFRLAIARLFSPNRPKR